MLYWLLLSKNKCNEVSEQLSVHMVHICWTFSVKQIFKTEGVQIKSYDINSLLEGYSILNTGLFQANTLYSLWNVLKFVLKLT